MIPQEINDHLVSFFLSDLHKELKIHYDNPLSGGSINSVYQLNTNEGDYCLKYNQSSAYPGIFEKEAMGLELLRSSRGIRVPGVITVQKTERYSFLLVEYIMAGPRTEDFFSDFGHSLAHLHQNYGEAFGLGHDNYMGSLEQCNTIHQDWTSFFIEERLEKQLLLTGNKGYFSSSDIAHFQHLYRQLPSLCPVEKPSLLHGDLWCGNFIVSEEGKACLIDPAVYYGHREIDIAMSTLFGGFDTEFYNAYNEVFPMEKGWKERMDIYNLYPLLVHLNLFGAGYLGIITRFIRKF
ncbi:MAG: fructosamine kinase family protein [Bacteroidetes bacterium]|nr:fructosamine kinase family protein [Bacteroidota bacterium]